MRKTAGRGRGAARGRRGDRRVHARVPQWLRPRPDRGGGGRRHRGRDRGRGPRPVDFMIVASGPNGGQPAPRASRTGCSAPGDPVVVDIGGTMPGGYCSDCTRTYASASRRPGSPTYYAGAQGARRPPARHVRPGVSAEAVDAAARRADHRGRLRRALHPPHRARHRAGDATRSPTSWRATPSCSSRAWRSPSSPASTPGGTAPGSRTSWCAVTTGADRLNNADRELVVAGALMSLAHRECASDEARAICRAGRRAGRRRSSARGGRPRSSAGAFPTRAVRAARRGRPAGPALPRGARRRRPAVRGVPAGARGAGGGPGWPSGSGVSVHTLSCFPLATSGTDGAAGTLAARHARRRPAGRVLPVRAAQRLGRGGAGHPGGARTAARTSSTGPRRGSRTPAWRTSTRCSPARRGTRGRRARGISLPARSGRHARAVRGRARAEDGHAVLADRADALRRRRGCRPTG